MKYSRKIVGEVCSIVTKGTTPTTLGKKFTKKGIPFLRIQNLQEGKVVLNEDTLYIDNETDSLLKRSRIQENDVLLSIAGTIGRSAVVNKGLPFLNCNQAVAIIRLNDTVDPHFFKYWLDTSDAQNQICGSKVTATISNLSLSLIKQLKIPIPSIEEQKRIAAILDKADAIRRKRRQAIQLADEFLRSVFLDIFGDPVTNPKGYNSAPLGDLVEIISGATPSKTEKRFWNGMFPWVSPKDMKSITINNSIDKISESVFSETSLKKIPIKSVLIVNRGMILAHTIPIAITAEEVAINQDIKALMTRGSLLPEFLLWSLLVQHNFILSKVSTAAHGTKRLDTADLQQIKISLPGIELQDRFIEIVHKFSNINDQIAFSLEEAENLFHTLVQKAFRGEL